MGSGCIHMPDGIHRVSPLVNSVSVGGSLPSWMFLEGRHRIRMPKLHHLAPFEVKRSQFSTFWSKLHYYLFSEADPSHPKEKRVQYNACIPAKAGPNSLSILHMNKTLRYSSQTYIGEKPSFPRLALNKGVLDCTLHSLYNNLPSTLNACWRSHDDDAKRNMSTIKKQMQFLGSHPNHTPLPGCIFTSFPGVLQTGLETRGNLGRVHCKSV